ncbi:MAG: hypothetical protein K2X38_09350 [Gemmataceae bacterium]|nr:hypothetical protein [Gemmataceae bacterium]
MTAIAMSQWESKKTDETRLVESTVRKGGFLQVDAYRYNSAVIRVRVIDERFHGLSVEQRDAMVEPFLAQLPESTQGDIVTLMTFAPDEVNEGSSRLRERLLNLEFEDPSRTGL